MNDTFFADVRKLTHARNALLATRDVFCSWRKGRINLFGNPAIGECRQHAAFALDLLENLPGLLSDLIGQLIQEPTATRGIDNTVQVGLFL